MVVVESEVPTYSFSRSQRLRIPIRPSDKARTNQLKNKLLYDYSFFLSSEMNTCHSRERQHLLSSDG